MIHKEYLEGRGVNAPVYRRPARLKKLLLGFGVVGLMAGLVVPSAFAAPAGPMLIVTSLSSDSVTLKGSGFTKAKTAQLEASIGNCIGRNQAPVAGGGFKASFRATATCRGLTTITATAGSTEISASVLMGDGTTTTKASTAKPASKTTPQSGTQKLGVGGVAVPAGAIKTTKDSTEELSIDEGGTEGKPKVYDGGGHKVGKITIKTSNVVVQNFKVCPNGRYGIEAAKVNFVTIQNNDIKCIKGPGDLNAITFNGNNINVLYNTAIDWVVGDPGDSHTDFIQTWNNDPGESSSNIVIKGNKATGPLKGEGNFTIHQCIMAQGKAATDGGGGGSGVSENWLIADNYFKDDWNQCIKLEDIDNAHVTRNIFAGASSRVIEIRETSEGTKYYSDNKVTGKYESVGADVAKGAGPTSVKPSASKA